MADISKITLPSGQTYDIKDATARAAIAGGVAYIGVSTTSITDGGSQKPTINGEAITPINGNLVIYDNAEFIFSGDYGDGGAWSEFGDMSNLGDLAYQDSASGSFTPSGSVSQPTFTGTPVRLVGRVTVPYTYTFSGSTTTSTGTFTPSGSVTVTPTKSTVTVSPASSGTTTYTPAGTVTQPNFTGSSTTFTGSFTPSGSVTISEGTGTANYTPEGTVSAPTISVGTAGSTTTVKNPTSKTVVTSVSTGAPSSTALTDQITWCDVSDETLRLYRVARSTGASITTSNVTVKTGDASYTASAPSFTGTGAQLTASFSGTSGSVSVSGTPNGSVSQPTFSGTGVRLKTDSEVATGITSASFSGTSGNVSVSGTPSGGVVAASHTDKTVTVSVASSGTATYTPEGTVSQPTFTGTAGTVTVD